MSLLVIRTSSMGDVILTLPLLRSFNAAYPDDEVVFVTKRPFDRFVAGIPGVKIFLSDHHGRHKGIIGVFRVYRDIRKEHHISAVADLHDVLRSKLLRLLFQLRGCRVAVIDKGRREKRALTRGRQTGPLLHTLERYRAVFAEAGFPLAIINGPWLFPSEAGKGKIMNLIKRQKSPFIGVAPLAKHSLKIWPVDKMTAMLNMLKQKISCTIFIFGSPSEADAIADIASHVPDALSVAGTISLEEEVALISRLDLMIAMDSSNMHLASMAGIDTISIWGATHPWAGFGAWGMPEENQVQIPVSELTCRPCTVYGKGECRRGDLACLDWLTSEMVLEKVLGKLHRFI